MSPVLLSELCAQMNNYFSCGDGIFTETYAVHCHVWEHLRDKATFEQRFKTQLLEKLRLEDLHFSKLYLFSDEWYNYNWILINKKSTCLSNLDLGDLSKKITENLRNEPLMIRIARTICIRRLVEILTTDNEYPTE